MCPAFDLSLPLDGGLQTVARKSVAQSPFFSLPEPVSPLIFPPSHTITAEVIVPEGGAEGVIAGDVLHAPHRNDKTRC